MSYDLFTRRRPDTERPDVAAVRAWFEGRPHWVWRDWGARYANEVTGATFDANVCAADATPADENGAGITFEMGGTAAHVVGFEMVAEIKAFLAVFDVLLEDPQMDGMGKGELDEVKLLAGWNAYNGFATKVAHTSLGQPFPPMMRAAKLEAAWRWNRHAEGQDDDARFVPKVQFLAGENGDAETFALWVGGVGDLPEVDSVQHPLRRVPFGVIAKALGTARRIDAPAPHYRIDAKLAKKVDAAIEAATDALPFVQPIAPHGLRTREVLEPFLGVDPVARGRAFARRLDANMAQGEGRFDEALTAREEVAALLPDDADVAAELAIAAHQANRQRRAYEAGLRALELDANSQNGALIAAVNGWYVAEFEGALTAVEKLLALAPAHRTGLQIRCVVLTDLARYDEAVESADQAIAISFDPMMENSRAFALAAGGRTDEAKEAYSRALAALDEELAADDSKGDVHSRRAYALLGLGRNEDALAAAERALELQKDPFLTLQSIGRAQLALGRPKLAVKALDKAMKLRESAPLAAYHLALAHALLGDEKKAKKAFVGAAWSPHWRAVAGREPAFTKML